MDQSTTPKPVMDVMPPKPAVPAANVLLPTDSDSAVLPSANPSLEQVGSRTDATVAGGTGVRAPSAPQPSGEHDGEASASDRTRTPEPAGGSKDALAVHTAPPLSDDDKASAAAQTPSPQAAQQKPTAHSGAPKTHGPAGAITFVVLAMLVLSALAILVYLNS